MLNGGLDRSLTLVCAPAGFGKSTLLSAWLETCAPLHAWVSLDENDNNLTVFLSYFVAAIQSMFPEDGGRIYDFNLHALAAHRDHPALDGVPWPGVGAVSSLQPGIFLLGAVGLPVVGS